MEFPGAQRYVNSLTTGSKVILCTSKLFTSTPVFPVVVSRGAWGGGALISRCIFCFLGVRGGGGGGGEAGDV